MRFAVLKRLLVFAAAIAACLLGYLFLLGLPALGREGPFAGAIPALLLAVVVYALNRRFLRAENRTMAALGFDAPTRRAKQFGVAFLGGCVLAVGWGVILTVAMGVRWQPHAGFHILGVVGLLGFAFFNNAAEELAYRGYAFLTLVEAYGPVVAVVGTSVVFALLHLQAGVPPLSVLAGVLTTAFVFGVLFLRWRSVPLVLGFHLATNVMQELIGLRLSAASMLEPVFPTTAPVTQIRTALMLTAALNILVALGLAWLRSPRKVHHASTP
jgi:membrane protease YdiL (CAAX protease family)